MEHSKKLDLSISAADLERIEQILDYHFSRPERVALALTHSSWANEHGLGQAHNERLEFLGDAVLELCISWELFTRFPQAREGDMTRVRSQLVGTTSLAQRARETGIDQLLRLGRGEERQGGRSRDAVLSDVFEAVLASVYEDGGYAAAQKVVARIFGTLLDEVCVGKPKTKDFKTSLQERSVALFHDRPVYTTLACEGPEHARHFTVQVSLPSGQQFTATGTSCKKAEQEAARLALCALEARGEAAARMFFAGGREPFVRHPKGSLPPSSSPHPSQTRFTMEDDG